MQNNCCGNFICEVGESNCSDCGPFAVKTPSCSTCLIPYGEMFDVEAIKNITLTSIEFMVRSGSNTVTIFTAPGRYSNKQRNSTAWTKIYNGTFVGTSSEYVREWQESQRVLQWHECILMLLSFQLLSSNIRCHGICRFRRYQVEGIIFSSILHCFNWSSTDSCKQQQQSAGKRFKSQTVASYKGRPTWTVWKWLQ